MLLNPEVHNNTGRACKHSNDSGFTGDAKSGYTASAPACRLEPTNNEAATRDNLDLGSLCVSAPACSLEPTNNEAATQDNLDLGSLCVSAPALGLEPTYP